MLTVTIGFSDDNREQYHNLPIDSNQKGTTIQTKD